MSVPLSGGPISTGPPPVTPGPPLGTFDLGGNLLGQQGSSLQFFDETGINPLPAGIFVTVINTVTGALIASAWTQPGGYCAISVNYNVEYTASFSLSSQAPQTTVTFTPGVQAGQALAVTVEPYRSPSLSLSGYALLQMAKLVRGWFGDTAKALGGMAYAIGAGGGAGLADLDAQVQYVLQIMRLQSSLDGDIDSWSLDMVGEAFARYPAESDQLFIARNELMVSRPRCSINAIQAFVVAFYTSILAGWNVIGTEALGFDTAGSFDTSGGFDTPPAPPVPKSVPPILVWDAMTNPQYAALFGISAPQFVIQIGTLQENLIEQLGFDVAGAYGGGPVGQDPGSGGFDNNVIQGTLQRPTATPPDARLGTLVNLIAKAGGTQPMYLVGNL